MKKHDLPQEIQDRIDQELLSEENLLWVGQAHPFRFLTVQESKTHPLLSAAIALEILLFIFALSISALVMAGVLLLTLILSAIMGGLWQQIFLARNTIYAITNQRAMIINRNNVQTFRTGDLQSITKKTRKTGRGDIVFRRDSEMRLRPSGFGFMLQRPVEKEVGFLGIEHPDHVEALLLHTFAEESKLNTTRLEDSYYEPEININTEDSYKSRQQMI